MSDDIYFYGTRTGDYPISCGLQKFDGHFTPYKKPDELLYTDLGVEVPYGLWSIHGVRFPAFKFGIHAHRFGYYTGWNTQLQFTYAKSACSPWLNAVPAARMCVTVSYKSYITGNYVEFGTFRSGNWWYANAGYDRLDLNIPSLPSDMAVHIDYNFFPVNPSFWEDCHDRRKCGWCSSS